MFILFLTFACYHLQINTSPPIQKIEHLKSAAALIRANMVNSLHACQTFSQLLFEPLP